MKAFGFMNCILLHHLAWRFDRSLSHVPAQNQLSNTQVDGYVKLFDDGTEQVSFLLPVTLHISEID